MSIKRARRPQRHSVDVTDYEAALKPKPLRRSSRQKQPIQSYSVGSPVSETPDDNDNGDQEMIDKDDSGYQSDIHLPTPPFEGDDAWPAYQEDEEPIPATPKRAESKSTKRYRAPKLRPSPKFFRKCETYQQIEDLARRKQPLMPRSHHIPLLPDEVLFNEDHVNGIVEERINHPHFNHEVFEFPDYTLLIERLAAENEVLKQQLSYEKGQNADLAGNLSRYRELARRTYFGDKTGWDNRNQAFIELIDALLSNNVDDDCI